MKTKTSELARGKWPGILTQLDVAEHHLKNKHGPCPLCEGKDRFRFDDKEGRGTYYCNQCGSGDGFDLLMKLHGWSFDEAAKKVDSVVGNVDAQAQPFQRVQSEESKRRNLNAVWRNAQQNCVILTYMNSRGIPHGVLEGITTMRGSTRLWDSGTGLNHVGLVSLIQDIDGAAVSLHRIYFEQGKRWKKIMPPIGTISGAAIRLGNGDYPVTKIRNLSVAEGVESGLAVRHIEGGVVWCGISAHGVRDMRLPSNLKRLRIYADNDRSFTGQAASLERAYRYKVSNPETEVSVYIPVDHETDPLDMMVILKQYPDDDEWKKAFRGLFVVLGADA